MSKQIDERVVSMQFDNKRFEQNVHTTIGTLEKLKQSLNLSGASKGLENVNAASKKIDMSGLGSAVDTVQAKFSAMGVVGVTALANITNQAVNAGKRIVSALTIDPVKTGFSEYELKMGSIQTIMASTGEELEKVNGYLNELNEYSDRTIYSYSDMTQNIGKFTNAGVKLEDAVLAIKGISNEAAVSGATTAQASHAMYNFAQALSQGYVNLLDWKSIQNASMDGVEFKKYLLETAEAMGTVTKTGKDMYETLEGNVVSATTGWNDALKDQWLTTDVLISTLKDYADETTEIGKKAYAAAGDVKTLSQMWGVMKESAQSGWAKSWEIVVGDFEESKEMFTNLTNTFTGFIDKMSKARNAFLGKGLSSKWEQLTEKINEAGIETETFETVLKETAKENGIEIDELIEKHETLANVIKKGKIPADIFKKAIKKLTGAESEAAEVTDKVVTSAEELEAVVKRVIRGDFGNGADRVKALTEAGYNYYQVQNKVNEVLGYSFRHSVELTEAQIAQADSLVKLSDKQLENKGYTEDQIEALRELEKAADESGSTINELINGLTLPSGRELISETFAHLGEELSKITAVVKEVFFNDKNKDTTKSWLYDLIKYVHDFVMELEVSEKSVENFKTVLEGLKAAFDLGHSVASMSVMGAIKILSTVLSLFDMNILDVAAHISEYIIKLRDWVFEHTIFGKTFDKIASILKAVIDGVIRCKNAFMQLKPVQDFIQSIKDLLPGLFGDLDSALNIGGINKFIDTIEKAFDTLEKWIKSLENSENLGQDIFNGILSIFDKIKNALTTFVKDIAETWSFLNNIISFFNSTKSTANGWIDELKEIKAVKFIIEKLGKAFDNVSENIKEAYNIGKNVIEGIKKGLEDGSLSIGNVVGMIIKGLIDTVKSLLGIHSPSKVFFIIGGFIIAGLIGGLLGGIPDINTALTSIKDTLFSFFEGLDIGTVIAAGLGIASLVMVKKALDIFKKFGEAAEGIGKMTSGIGKLASTLSDGIQNKINPPKWKQICDAIIKVALAIAILVGAVYLLTTVDDAGKLWNAVGVLAAVAVILGALMVVADKFVDGKNIDRIGPMLIKISGAIAIMAIVARILGEMDRTKLEQGIEFIAYFGMIIMLLMGSTKFISGSKNVDKIGGTLFKVAGAIAVMAIVARILGEMDRAKLEQGLEFITYFGMIIMVLMASTKFISGSKNIDNIGSTLFKVAGAIAIMAIVAKVIGSMDPNQLKQGTIAIGVFSGIIVGLMAATKLISGSKNVDKIGGSIFKIAAAIAVMVIATKIAASMSSEEVIQGGAAVLAFSGIIVGLMAATKLICGSKNVDKIGGTIFKIAGAIAIMAIVAKIAASMSPGELAKGTIAIGIFSGIIVGLMAATKLISGSENVDKIGNTLLKVSGAIAIMAVSVALLSLINPKRLAGATLALSLLIGMFALLTFAASKINGGMATLIVLTVAVGVLAIALGVLSTLPVESTIGSAIALSALMLAMAGVLAILSMVGKTGASALLGVLALLALAVPMLAFVGILALMQNIQNATANALVLGALIAALSIILVPLAIVGTFAASALLGVLALLALAVPMLAFVGILALMQNIQNATVNVDLLTSLITTLTKTLIVLALIGPLALVGVAAMAALTALIVGIGALAIGIGALMEKCPTLEEFLNKGIPILEQLSNAVGSIIANLINGFMTGLADGLPEIGLLLSQFMINAMPFVMGIKMVDSSMLEGIKVLAAAILALTAAELINNLASFASNGSSFADLGTQLSQFMMNAVPFITMANMIKPEAMKGVKSLAEAILTLTGANLIESVTSFLGGSSSLSAFGSQLGQFATDIKTFITNLGTISDDQVTAVDSACNIITSLAEVADKLPNDGGWAGKIFGENSISAFAEQLPGTATAIAGFITNLGEISDDKLSAVDCACKVITSLAEVADKLPNDGGWLDKIFGDNSLVTFGEQLPELATNISNFIANLGTLGEEQIATINGAAKVISAISKLSNFDKPKEIKSFGTNLNSVGKKLKSFADTMSAIDSESITGASTKIDSVISMINKIIALDSDNIKSVGDSLKKLGKDGIKQFVKAVSGEIAKTDITVAGKKLITVFITAVEDKYKSVETAFEKVGTKALKQVTTETLKGKFKSAGKEVVKGFANGITENTWIAEAKAEAMANAAEDAAREALDINSPSKVFRKIGMSVPEGFAMGIDKLKSSVTSSSEDMAQSSIRSVTDAIGRVSELVNSGIDAQPTIRPVLDLSSVESGANAIGNMLYGNRTISVDTSTVGSISASMQGIQNRRNSNELLSAIKGLRSDISSMPRNSYSIGDITYDDGSNVANAINELVRAAMIERRV